MLNRRVKGKGITTNHKDCIKQMDTLYTKLEEKEGDYNNLLLQNNTLRGIVENSEKTIKKQNLKIQEQHSLINDLQEKVENIGRFLIDFGFENQDELKEFVIKYKNKDNKTDIKSSDYIELQNKNSIMEKQIEGLNITVNTLNGTINNLNTKLDSFSINDNKYIPDEYNLDVDLKIKKALDEQKIIFNKELQERENKYNTLYNDFNILNKGIPTPSSSTDNKKEKKKSKNKDIDGKLICSKCNKEIIDKNINKEICINCLTLDTQERIKNKISFEKVDDSVKGYEAINALINKNYKNMEIYFDIHKKAMISELDTIEYNDLIHDIIKKNKDETSISRLKNKIKRSSTLLQEFGDKLQYINISTKYLGYMTKIEFNVLYNYLKDLFIEENETEEYSCKNECCSDYVNTPDTYCEDCAQYVKYCIDCDEDFSDEFTNCKKCFDCRDE